MDSKDKWIQETENSIDGIGRAEANPYLYHKILEKIRQKALTEVKPKLVWASMATLVLLLAINILALKLSRRSASPEAELKQLSAAMNLVPENTLNYE